MARSSPLKRVSNRTTQLGVGYEQSDIKPGANADKYDNPTGPSNPLKQIGKFVKKLRDYNPYKKK